MSVSCGFFNSSNKDRLYDARQFSSIFDGVINDGVYMGYGGHFAVTAMSTPSLSVNLASGRAWFNHTWTLNDATMSMTFDNTMTGRCDAVVLQVDTTDAVRANKIYIKKGTEGSPTVKPVMVRENGVYEYPICYVTIPDTNAIAQSAIENKVGSSDTPYVTGIIDTIDTDDLIAQWQAQWNEYFAGIQEDYTTWTNAKQAEYEAWVEEFEAWYAGWQADETDQFIAWFNRMKDQLSEDAAGHLQLEIDDLSAIDSALGLQIKELKEVGNDFLKASNGMINSLYKDSEDQIIEEPIITDETGNDIAFALEVIYGMHGPEKPISGTSWYNYPDSKLAELREMVDAGDIDLKNDLGWDEGDIRKVTLSNGKVMPLVLINNTNNAIKLQDGLTPATFLVHFDDYIFDEPVFWQDVIPRNTSIRDAYGQSSIRTKLNGEIFNTLPQGLQSFLRQFKIKTWVNTSGTKQSYESVEKIAMYDIGQLISTAWTDATLLDYFKTFSHYRLRDADNGPIMDTNTIHQILQLYDSGVTPTSYYYSVHSVNLYGTTIYDHRDSAYDEYTHNKKPAIYDGLKYIMGYSCI